MYRKVNVKSWINNWIADHIVELVVLGTFGFMVLVAGVLIYANLTSGYHMVNCTGVGCP